MLTTLQLIDNIIATIPIVRWGLVISLLGFIATSGVLYINMKRGDLQIALLKSDLAQTESAFKLQSERILELGRQADAQKKTAQQAVIKATRIAVENKKLQEELGKIQLKGTCDEKVKQTLGIITTNK